MNPEVQALERRLDIAQHMRSGLQYKDIAIDAIALLNRMAQGEPYAWHLVKAGGGEFSGTFTENPTMATKCEHDGYIVTPLYTHAAQTDGMVLVPREPTEAMLDAAVDDANEPYTFGPHEARCVWNAMIAAAPATVRE